RADSAAGSYLHFVVAVYARGVCFCEEAHLQSAQRSFTLVRIAYLVKERHFVNAAVRLSELRAYARAPLGRVSARHQLAGRAKVRVPQLLLSADHSGRLLWRAAVRRFSRALHRVTRLLLSGDPRIGDG